MGEGCCFAQHVQVLSLGPTLCQKMDIIKNIFHLQSGSTLHELCAKVSIVQWTMASKDSYGQDHGSRLSSDQVAER